MLVDSTNVEPVELSGCSGGSLGCGGDDTGGGFDIGDLGCDAGCGASDTGDTAVGSSSCSSSGRKKPLAPWRMVLFVFASLSVLLRRRFIPQ